MSHNTNQYVHTHTHTNTYTHRHIVVQVPSIKVCCTTADRKAECRRGRKQALSAHTGSHRCCERDSEVVGEERERGNRKKRVDN